MVFQDPLSALNPVYTAGWQIAEMFRVHRGLSSAEAGRRAVGLLKLVGMPDAEQARPRTTPMNFSGGMRQRLVIAMALAVDPVLVVADEPTTALDVTVEAQILSLLKSLQKEKGVGLVIITHSMGVVAEIADRVNVMYAGRVVESGDVGRIFETPSHPYTVGLARLQPTQHERTPADADYRTAAGPCRLFPAAARSIRDAPSQPIDVCMDEPPLEPGRDGAAHLVACHHKPML